MEMTGSNSTVRARALMLKYSETLRQLEALGVVKTRNGPVGDYTEWLVKEAFGGELKGKSTKRYDLVKREKDCCTKYQIKGSWLDPGRPNKQLSIIRAAAIDDKLFDFLIGVLFTNDFEVEEAWKISRDLITKHAGWSKSQGGGWVVHLQGAIIKSAINIKDCLEFNHQDAICTECGGGKERDQR